MHAIQTFELTKRYGSRPAKSVLAVDRISFAVEQGQVFGFLGPNGSGKTTTIGMLVGTIKPTDGSFNLFGASGPKRLMAARARVGATLETPNFYPYMSGRDNLHVAAAVKGVGLPRIEECLELVGLSDRANHRFKTYSLGMKQRLALAATMLSDPELIFALPESWPVILGTAAGIGPLFIGALMILLVAQEFSWRTARQNVIDGLSKERFYTGKVLLLAGLVLLFTATPVLIGVGGTMLSPGEGGPGSIRASDFGQISGLVLGMLLFGSAGLMLSVHLRSSGASLGILFLYLFVEEGVAMLMLGTGRESLRNVAEFLPFNVVEDLGDDLVHYPEVLAEVNAERAEAGLAPLEFLDVEVLAIAALTYTAFFLGLSLLNMRRRDL